MPTYGNNLNLSLYQLLNARAQNLASDPAFSAGESGRFWLNGTMKMNNGSSIVSFRDTGTLIVNGDLAGSIALSKLATDPLARANHTGSQTASTISDLATVVKAYKLSDFAAPTAAVPFGTQKITGLGDPTSAQDAATKNYVDNLAQGVQAKRSVVARTTGNVSVASSPSIPGVTAPARVLVMAQTAPAENGIYVYNGAGNPLVRANDADTWSEIVSAFVFVEQDDTGWLATADQGGTLGTTAINWVQFSSAGDVLAGSGLQKVGNTISVANLGITNGMLAGSISAGKLASSLLYTSSNIANGLMWADNGSGAPYLTTAVDNSTLETGPTATTDFYGQVTFPLKVKDLGITGAKLATGAVDLAGTKVTGTLPLGGGGTGATTAAGARTALGAVGKYATSTHAAGTTITVTAVTHGLGTGIDKDVITRIASTGERVYADDVVASNGDVTVTFGASQGANTIRVTVIG